MVKTKGRRPTSKGRENKRKPRPQWDFNYSAFRNNLKKNERLEDYERLFMAVIDRDFSKKSDVLTYHVETALDLDLIGVEEVTSMASVVDEELYNNDLELVQSLSITSACDNAPHDIRDLIVSRSRKAYQIVKNAHAKGFSMPDIEKIPNGFMGWKRFSAPKPKSP